MEIKNKYINNKYYISDNIIKDGDDLVSLEYYNENSRFNIVTKECKHWYALKICNYIINDINNNDNKNNKYNILVLGVELGGIIIHLLNKLNNIHVTGIDISDTLFHIVSEYSPKDRLTLIKQDADEFVKNTKDKYNYVICDISIPEAITPPFVMSNQFLKNINNKLYDRGSFLINTATLDKTLISIRLKDAFPNCVVSINPRIHGTGIVNVVSIVSK
jgi:2-polyprenyl-3-methyl-5-hydroxy-6-metoxy-1,4-benzoquinol methylase